MTALSFERVSKRYRRSAPPALDDISFTIETGARACLLGPNGAGKSTAIRLLQGALRPTAGRVTLLNAEIDSDAYLAARRRTGVVPQGPGMYADLTTEELLQLARDLFGHGSLERVVDVFGLGDHLRKPLAQLSGGLQRRAVLAAALVAEPDLLLLDEPTVGLDPVAAHDVHAFLRDSIRQAGRTTLLCTHNLAEAEALCEEVIILRDGRVLVHAPLAELRRRVRPQVRLEARQAQATLLDALRHRELDARPEPDGRGVLVVLDDAARHLPDLLRGLLADGLDVFACQPLQPTLESVFLDIVRGPA